MLLVVAAVVKYQIIRTEIASLFLLYFFFFLYTIFISLLFFSLPFENVILSRQITANKGWLIYFSFDKQ